MGLPRRNDVPVIGMVTRLAVQKGIDLVEWALPSFLEDDTQFVVLGTGEPRYEESIAHLVGRFQGKAAAFFTYDDELADKVFAGSDILLVPSRYEPCGLAQLYGMRYGAIPLVRATGGLMDTVDECVPEEDSGTGFKFVEADPSVLDETVRRAVSLAPERSRGLAPAYDPCHEGRFLMGEVRWRVPQALRKRPRPPEGPRSAGNEQSGGGIPTHGERRINER